MPATTRPLPTAPGAAASPHDSATGLTPPILVLAAAAVASLPFVVLSIADAGGLRVAWDNLHWTISAVGAALAAVGAVRGTTGRVRAVRSWAAVALVLWMVANVAWAVMSVFGSPSVPSIADAAIAGIMVPGIAVLVATVHGRLTAAEEAAVYLDGALVFLFIGSLLIWVFGSVALGLHSAAGIVTLVYPTGFIGLGGAGLIAVLAIGYPIAPRGALALLGGSVLIGLAYVGWLTPTLDLAAPGELPSVLFTLGTLVTAYGAVTWFDERSRSLRYLAMARTATRTVAPVVASLLFVLVLAPVPPAVEGILHVAIFAASIVFIVRQGLLLQERTATLSRVRILTDENSRLVRELRGELERRAADQRRMIQTSRAAAVGDLASGVAHEVNNPLTGVLGFAEILIEESAPDDPRLADLVTIRDEALRAREIVRALRDFASPRPPELVETDLSVLIHQTVDLLRYSIERRGITIHEDLPTLPPISIDGSAVQQALLNVLTNARQAMDDDGRLDVAVRPDGDGQLISVTDNGVGMDAATVGLAFDPFFSGRDTSEDLEPAAGLGLSVSSGLIESHGGTISISSAPGRGTTVEIRIPAGGATDANAASQVGMVE